MNKLSILLALITTVACASHNEDCDPTSLENLEFGTCNEPWSDENVPEFSAQGNLAMFRLCREAAAMTRVESPSLGGPQDIVYCVKNDTSTSYPLAWGKGFRPGTFLVNSHESMIDLIKSYYVD